jgi:ribosomal protein S18 acetylase RimI-like enzyme
VDAVVRLWREMWDFHQPLDSRFQVTSAAEVVMTKWIEDCLQSPRSAVFVAEESPGAVEGYCHAMLQEYPPLVPHPQFGYVSELSVHRRRRGVGARLLEEAHAWFREKGLTYVEVNVAVKNSVAKQFWRKHGYTEFIERLRLEL